MKGILTVPTNVVKSVHMAIVYICKGVAGKLNWFMCSRMPFFYRSKKLTECVSQGQMLICRHMTLTAVATRATIEIGTSRDTTPSLR